MHQRNMQRVFLGAVFVNIVFAVGAGLKREEAIAVSGVDVHGLTDGSEAGAGLLVLVGEGSGGSADARIVDESHSKVEGAPPESLSGVEERAVIPHEVTVPHEPLAAPALAGDEVTAVTIATESHDRVSGATSIAAAGSADVEVVALGSPGEVSQVETADAPIGQRDGGKRQVSPDTAIAAERPSSCVRIGPFVERPDVGRLLAGLSDSISPGDSYTTELADRPIFWVHVSPRGSIHEAQVAQKDLAARGIESFVISDLGPLHNGISLGVFRDPDSAKRLASARAGIGYPVAVHESLGKRTVHFARVRVSAEHAERLVEALDDRAEAESTGASADLIECDEGFNARVAGAGGHR